MKSVIKSRKIVRKMKVRRYTVVLEPQPEGGFTVTVPALFGCVTEGDTEKEALQNAQDAISLYLEDLMADGEPIPADIRPINKFIFLHLPIGDSQTTLTKA